MKKMLFIINPKAGKRKNRGFIEQAIDVFEEAGYYVGIKYTTKQLDGIDIASKFGNKVDLVVCMGGDGTLSEVIEGLVKINSKTPLGYIPAGSTNDFATSLGLKFNPKEQAEFIVSHEARDLDLGVFNNRIFIYTASAGIFTKTSYSTPQELKNRLGHFAYILTGVKELFKIRRLKLNIKLEDEVIDGTFIFVAINNATKIGGVMRIDEKLVEYSDGVFELFLIEYPKTFNDFIKIMFNVLTQKYKGKVTLKQIKYANITDSSEIDWSLDGEKEKGKESVEFKVLHNGVKFIY